MENFIHPTAIVGPDVTMGRDNYIGPFCYITGRVLIGNNNRFEAFCSIGTRPEHKRYWGEEYNAGVIIGGNNTIREYVTINAGTKYPTLIASKCIFLRGSHVGHDVNMGDQVTVSCNVLIGGECVICKDANLGLGCIIHQQQQIAEGCMIGMGAVITKKLKTEPYKTYIGNPARLLGENTGHPNYTVYMKEYPNQ